MLFPIPMIFVRKKLNILLLILLRCADHGVLNHGKPTVHFADKYIAISMSTQVCYGLLDYILRLHSTSSFSDVTQCIDVLASKSSEILQVNTLFMCAC